MLFYFHPSERDVRCLPCPHPTSTCPAPVLFPSPGFTPPSLGTEFHHPTAGSFFFFPSSGDEKADESALLWIHANSLFPQRSPQTASAHLLLHRPAASQPTPAPPASQAGHRPPSRSPEQVENILKKWKSVRKEALHPHNHRHAPRAAGLDFSLVTVPALDQPYSF